VAGRALRRNLGRGAVALGLLVAGAASVYFAVWRPGAVRAAAIRDDLAAAQGALDRDEPKDAEAAWRRVLATDPRQPEALAGLGMLAFESGELETARTLLERARAAGHRSPGVEDALRSLADVTAVGAVAPDQAIATIAAAEVRARVAAAEAVEAEARAAAAEARAREASAGAAERRAAAQAEAHAARESALAARRAERAAAEEEATARAAEARARSAAAADTLDPACLLPTVARGNSLLVDVTLDGHPARLVLDTGATATVLTRRTAEAAGLSIDDENRRRASTANGVAEFSPALVGTLAIGDRAVRELTVATCDACDAIGADGLLGVDVLRALQVRVDLPTRTAHFADCE
jgi:clan AA aspartic protease (TIGR02281 family)